MSKTIFGVIVLCCVTNLTTSNGNFVDNFDGTTALDENWLPAFRQWGGNGVNGGVLPENILVPNDGTIVLRALGDRYNDTAQQ
eukprot:m.307825 g.307825  ORF g.307825 m.307825 type:complete len:83 (+) comp16466_c1_seq5:210-458(+)